MAIGIANYPLAEFSYNNSYHSRIDMAPFEALYGRICRSPIGWFDAFEVRPWGTDLRGSEGIGEVAYELALPPGLSGVHPIFHVSMLKRYYGDGSYIIRWDSVLLDENLSYEEELVAILDREIRKLRSREIASIKVQWKNRPVEEATWEKEADMRERYPYLFTDSGTPFRPCFPSCDRSGTNDG